MMMNPLFGIAVVAVLINGGWLSGSEDLPGFGRIHRLAPRLDSIVPRESTLERIVDGHQWVEGPVWDKKGRSLFFSDIPANAIYRWKEGSGTTLLMKPSGYDGTSPFRGREPGSNGLTFDPDGRLIICEHGNRRITRVEQNGKKSVLVDRYEGKRLNSPNDVVVSSSGDLYFTDPPFGLPGAFEDPDRELDFCGVYRLSAGGTLTLLTDDLKAPNGIALSPDERRLYVSDVDPDRPGWLVMDLNRDGTPGRLSMLRDAREFLSNRPGGPDGIKVDVEGNIFTAGPGGIYIFEPGGELLGMIETGVATSNCGWGDDGSTLYITASGSVSRIRLLTTGAGFFGPVSGEDGSETEEP